MKRSVRRISDSTLNINLSELAHSLVRELALACKKVAIYGPQHPLAERALGRPFLLLEKIFRFKRFVNLNLQRGYLYVLNIHLKDSAFNREIIQFMQLQDVTAVLFERGITMTDFSRFAERFVARVDLSRSNNLLSNYLKEQNLTTVQVNSEQAFQMFENSRQYRGDVDGDFTVKQFVFEKLGNHLATLAEFDCMEEAALAERGIDYDFDIIRYLLPERIASLEWDVIRRDLCNLAEAIKKAPGDDEKNSLIDTYTSVAKLTDYHPDREKIIDNLDGVPKAGRARRKVDVDAGSRVDTIRIESREHTDNCLAEIFSPGVEEYDPEEFSEAFRRLLKTGQRDKAIDVIRQLLDHLESAQATYRQRALDLLLSCIGEFQLAADTTVVEDAIDRTIARITEQRETFEYSEFVWSLLEKLLHNRRYDLMSRLLVGIAIRRKIAGDVTIYDSMAIKKVFSNLNRPEIIRGLIDEMVRGTHQEAAWIRDILVAAGSESVAMELSHIISHPIRQVRQQALKILAELGKASLKVFSQILMDDAMFERESGRHELPDSKWYVIRNSIFVLGSLADPDGLVPLRLRINDPDVRVRREIVSALEQIGGEDACDLLIVMADDPVREIQESAMIVVGLIGTPEMVPLLMDAVRRNPQVAVRAIHSIGKIGGDEAKRFLIRLLEVPEELARLADNKASKDDLRLAVVKAMGRLGDSQAIGKIKQYKDNLSTTQKIFFKNSPLSKEISSILSRSK